jgi:hypothetical protein
MGKRLKEKSKRRKAKGKRRNFSLDETFNKVGKQKIPVTFGYRDQIFKRNLVRN